MPAIRYWTSYWKQEHWGSNAEDEYKPVRYSANSSFRKRGVSVGDVIYIISQLSGQLLLGGRMRVERFVSRGEAVRIFSRNDLYDTDEWVISGDSGTALRLRRQLAPEITKQLRFISSGLNEVKSLKFVNDRDLDRQSLRTAVRQLAAESASLLDDIIEMTDRLPRSSGVTTISAEQLSQYRTSTQHSMKNSKME